MKPAKNEVGGGVRLPKSFYERPLTPKEAQFATDNINIVWWYLDQQGLDRAEWFDVVIFRYLISVKRWFALPDLQKVKFVTVACNAMRSAIGNARRKSAKEPQTVTRNDQLADVELIIPKLAGDDLTGQVVTTLHEEMHLMDMFNRSDPAKYSGWFSSSHAKLSSFFQKTNTDIADDIDSLFEAFDKECKRITAEINAELRTATSTLTDQYYARTISYSDYKKAFNKLKREASEQIDYQCRNAMGGGISSLEDIYDALSGGSARDAGLVRYGHGSKYYRDIGKRAEETLANYGALSVVRPDLIEMLRKDKPELVEALEEVIQDMLKKAGG